MPTRIDAFTESHIDDLCRLYRQAWWAIRRERDDVAKMIAHSVCVGFANDRDELVGFARAITDRVYKALVLDVVVDETHRGEGLGAAVMQAIIDHPDLAGVAHFELYCLPELVPFYERWGFTAELGELRFMRRS